MKHPHEPIDVITNWQEWYKKNCAVSCLNTPPVSNKTKNMDIFMQPIKNKTVENFADTIVDAMVDLSGAEVYKCFLQAAQENLEIVEREYKKAKQLVDYLTNKQ